MKIRNANVNWSGGKGIEQLTIANFLIYICNCSMCCCALPCVHSSFEIILSGQRELVALLFFFLVSRDFCVALPHGATDLSAVCGCGIS